MGEVINLKKHFTEQYTEDVITMACLEALKQVTQEINIVVHVFAGAEVDVNKSLARVKEKTGNDYYYILGKLCSIHGKNLIRMADAIERNTDPVSDEKAEALHREMETLPEKFREGSIIQRMLDNIVDEIDKQIEEEQRQPPVK